MRLAVPAMTWREHRSLRDRNREEIDPVLEGAHYQLAPDVAQAIWERVCREATDTYGLRDTERALRRFHQVAAAVAARGGRLAPSPPPGRVPRNGAHARARRRDPFAKISPGKVTRVMTQLDRWPRSARPRSPAPPPQAPADGLRVDRKAAVDAVAFDALSAALGFIREDCGGAPLPDALRAQLSRHLGVDLSGVRIHSDGSAARAAASIGARAFTVGKHVYFAEGAYDPSSALGIELIAHEMAHVAQHVRGQVTSAAAVSSPGDDHEQAADQLARMFMHQDPGDGRLPPAVQAKMERSLGADFSEVRIHHGPEAEAAGALAYTRGTDIYFQPGAYDPTSERGQQLLGHELVHVVQQAHGRVRTTLEIHGHALNDDTGLEREADVLGAAAARGDSAATHARLPTAHAAGPIQRAKARSASTAGSPLDFGEGSRALNKLGRVQAPRGVYLLAKPTPDAARIAESILPFDAPVFVTRTTLQPHIRQRWCFVVATGSGLAGFVPERYIAIDPPDPQSRLHRIEPGETLGGIARRVYGRSFEDGNDERLYVQGLYEANKDRAGVRLDHVDLSMFDTWHRSLVEEMTLRIYRGVKVLAGMSIWVPSEDFILRLKSTGAITSGSSAFSKAFRATRDVFNDVIDGVKYAAGFVVGLLEGAFAAIVDLFKGAAEVIAAVAKTLWHLITGNPGRIKHMLMGWVTKMKAVWENRAEIADEFMKKWNAADMWDRGLFQGEVLGWVIMTILLILITMGEDAPAAVAGIVTRWPQLVKLLQTVDTLGDVTKLFGHAIKTARASASLPSKARELVAGRLRKEHRAAHRKANAGDGVAKHSESGTPRANDTIDVHGYAQGPSVKWARNPDGAIRTIEEAIKIARSNDVDIPDDILLRKVVGKQLPRHTYAAYLSKSGSDPNAIVHWDDFYQRDLDELLVRVDASVFESDEAIVAILGHEMYELNQLRRLFDESGGGMTLRRLYYLINPGIKGNLHDQAWDVADALVIKMRRSKAIAHE